jgi:hypothetical protein
MSVVLTIKVIKIAPENPHRDKNPIGKKASKMYDMIE